jgi:hypothetical protein
MISIPLISRHEADLELDYSLRETGTFSDYASIEINSKLFIFQIDRL